MSQRYSSGKHEAVLAVNVPGKVPYAVFVRKFNNPARQGDVAGGGLPALVSSTDSKSARRTRHR